MTTSNERCPCHNPIPAEINVGTIGFIGERPGKEENFRRKNFVGRAGQELNQFLRYAGFPRDKIYTDNIRACFTVDDGPPTEDEIAACKERLLRNIASASPQVIVPLGVVATRFFIPEADMEAAHGIPHQWVSANYTDLMPNIVIVPTWNPAAGLRETFYIHHIKNDIAIAVEILRGQRSKAHVKDAFPQGQYREISSFSQVQSVLAGTTVIAADTETDDNNPYCFTFSTAPGNGYMVKFERGNTGVEAFRQHVRRPDVTTIMHNAIFDLQVFAAANIPFSNIEDTMVMAYLLQDLPQGLKPLAYRLCGMKMRSFEEVCRPHSAQPAIEYLVRAAEEKWPMPEPVLENKKGELHFRQPQALEKRINGIVRDYLKDPELDLWERWGKIDGKEAVEDKFGKMPGVSIKNVPKEEALNYACRDSDATIRVWRELKGRIEA